MGARRSCDIFLIVIKLPQEFWIHIAEMNTLDWIRSYPWTIMILAIWVGAIVIGLEVAFAKSASGCWQAIGLLRL